MSLNTTNNSPRSRRLRGEGRYCRSCHYPLNGLASPGNCPECGCDFDFTLLYSYAVDPPRTLLQRILSRRMAAFVVALLLESLMLWIVNNYLSMARRDPAWYIIFGLTFTIVWLLMFATGLDEACDEAWQFLIVGAFFGLLLFVPVGWLVGWSKLIVGVCLGMMTGGILFRLKVPSHGIIE